MTETRMLGDYIQELAQKNNCSENELCTMLSCNQNQLALLYKGRAIVSYPQIELLAKRFNVTTENLLSGDEVHYNKTVVHCMNEFQNPKNREEVLDFIDDYMDIFDAINQNKKK